MGDLIFLADYREDPPSRAQVAWLSLANENDRLPNKVGARALEPKTMRACEWRGWARRDGDLRAWCNDPRVRWFITPLGRRVVARAAA